MRWPPGLQKGVFAMFATIRAFFRLLRLAAGGEYGMVHVQILKENMKLVGESRTDFYELRDALDKLRFVVTDIQGVLAKYPSSEEFARVKQLAEQAYDITVGVIPNSGITATKAGLAGMPDSALEALKK